MEIELITSDGQAFVRSVPIEDDPERIAASFVVSLLTSVELERVQPDRDAVAAPATPLKEDVQQALEDARGEPEAEAEAEREAEREAEADDEDEPESPTEARSRPLPSPWSVDIVTAFGVLFGLVPTDFESRVGGGGGELSVLGRSPRKLLVGGSVRAYGRTSGRAKDDHSLLRVRVGATVGYVWTFRAVEVAAGGTLGLTTWSLRRGGTRVSAADLGAQSTLVGAAAWVAGGPVFSIQRPRLRTIRLGGRVELGGAFVLLDGARAVAVFDEEGNDLFRIGGLELTTGLDVSFTFARVSSRR